MSEPRTKAGRALLEREAYNERSFPLITVEAIRTIEEEAALAHDRPQGAHIDRARWESNADYRDGWNDGHRDGLQTAAVLSGSNDPEPQGLGGRCGHG
jgi:hypothetical protein